MTGVNVASGGAGGGNRSISVERMEEAGVGGLAKTGGSDEEVAEVLGADGIDFRSSVSPPIEETGSRT